ncbi:hypothetical protein H6P81_014536 [Aristolochia fimbriata]|uniref:BHLH domain-containing protein n=1 Tax=Aristolochia fimbriata TaxID=158543 RepID=A0AAV7EI13_ARIFI|nr:hypothetical protein H6P81_014536 [Aristolochia fimbriata]
MSDSSLCDLFDDPEFENSDLAGADSPENLFTILEALERSPDQILLGEINNSTRDQTPVISTALKRRTSGGDTPQIITNRSSVLVSQKSSTASSSSSGAGHASSSEGIIFTEADQTPPACKKLKFMETQQLQVISNSSDQELGADDGQQRMSHITVERNRRKQMNEHLSVLRSLMPSFYVKRGDQASIIGGVVDFIKELQQVLQSLEAKKQRKVYSEVLSPRTVSSSPRPSPLSPRPSPLSPRVMSLPISPRTPQPGSPYRPPPPPRMMMQQLPPNNYSFPPITTPAAAAANNGMPPSHHETPPPSPFHTSTASSLKDLAANSNSPLAQVEVKFSGPNLLLKTISQKIPGQASKIIAALQGLALEILQVTITTVDDTMLNSFTIKIGIECELSAEEVAHEIQQTFS